MAIMQHGDNHDCVFYASWKVQEFRSVDRFSDYQKIKSRLHQGDIIPGVPRQKRRSFFSDHRLNIVIAATGVMVLLATVVLILISLQVM